MSLEDPYGLPFIDVRNLKPSSVVLRSIPSSVARKRQLLPLRFGPSGLLVAVGKAPTPEEAASLSSEAGRALEFCRADPAELAEAIANAYPSGG